MANDVQTDKGTAALCRRLETLPVSVVSDVLNAMGFTDLEGKIKLDLEAGADREEVYRRNDRFAHIKRVR
jgi:hypothetical protein